MKFLIKNTVIFLLVFIMLNLLIYMLNTGHKINYYVGNFSIDEKLDTKGGNDYYFNIKSEKQKFNFRINHNYNKAKKVIKKLHFKEIDSYKCFLPVFIDGKLHTDIICIKDGIIYYASSLNNEKINNEFKKYGYQKNIYKDEEKEITLSNTETLYKDNIPTNNYLALESYKGLTLFNGKESNVKLFKNDVYKKPISIFTDKYYIVADYNSEYTFKNFYVVNIVNGNKTDIRSYDEISFDSYIMGAVDNDVYLFDKDAEKQYKISIKYESVEEVGNKNNIKYYNGSWNTISLNDALNEKKFTTNENIEKYEKVDKTDKYYYLYKKSDDKYIVYRADIENIKLKTYLFETTDINSIIYLKNQIYFKNNNDFCYFSKKGIRKVLTQKELEFNNDISLGAYEK